LRNSLAPTGQGSFLGVSERLLPKKPSRWWITRELPEKEKKVKRGLEERRKFLDRKQE